MTVFDDGTGGGVNSIVSDLAVFENGSGRGPVLCAGGEFITSPAGDSWVARWRGCPSDHATFGDVNGDGTVDGADLGILLASWGACPACAGCAADLDGNGAVDGADLGLLPGAWCAGGG